jgi:hypothetical protein
LPSSSLSAVALKPIRKPKEEIMNLVIDLYIHITFRTAAVNFVTVVSLKVGEAILAEYGETSK